MDIKLINNIKKLAVNINILYVEDEQDIKDNISPVFSKLFHHVEFASDGQDGLQKYFDFFQKNNKYYDLIISDINMPNIDGIRMSTEILKQNKKQKIIITSAYNDSDRLKNFIDLGIKKFVQKPITFDELFIALNEVLEQINMELEEQHKVNEIQRLNYELDLLIKNFDMHIIASRTDLDGYITYASKAFLEISGYEKDELIGMPHNIVRHQDMPKEAFQSLWETIRSSQEWCGEVKNKTKNGGYYWVKAIVSPHYDENGNHIGYTSIRHNITAQKDVEKLNLRIKNLLDNIEQGFLTFDHNMVVDSIFSKECERIFGNKIFGISIDELLFENDSENKDKFLFGINAIINSNDDLQQELLLSLLPDNIYLNNLYLTIKYKLLKNNKFMVIITDITEQKQLSKIIDDERQINKMIVNIVKNKKEFLELLEDFYNFIYQIENINSPDKYKKLDSYKLLRDLHTFKGLFAQKELKNITNAIHNIETDIKHMAVSGKLTFIDLNKHLIKFDLESFLDIDLKIVTNIMGHEYLHFNHSIDIDTALFNNVEKQLLRFVDNVECKYKQDVENIIFDFDNLREINLKQTIANFYDLVEDTASILEKEMKPLKIDCDKHIAISDTYKPFINSLIHVFRNCIDHGIEEANYRETIGKERTGSITVSIKISDNSYIFKIEDDGRGFDTVEIKNKILELGLMTQEQIEQSTDEEILKYIFMDSFSTKKTISKISGRGVGLSATKFEIDKLNGNIKIVNNNPHGAKFVFYIPYIIKTLDKILARYMLSQVSVNLSLFIEHYTDTLIKTTTTDLCECLEDSINIKYCSIDIFDKHNMKVIFGFENTLVDYLANKLIPPNCSEDEVSYMLQTVHLETSNIIFGNALASLPMGDQYINISPPLDIQSEELYNIKQNYKHLSTSRYEMPFGFMICSILNKTQENIC